MCFIEIRTGSNHFFSIVSLSSCSIVYIVYDHCSYIVGLSQPPFTWKCSDKKKDRQEITCSRHQKTKPRILQFTNLKCSIKTKEPFKTPFLMVYYFLFFTLKTFWALLFHFKGFKRHFAALWIGEFILVF